MFCAAERQQSPDGSQMPLFKVITLQPKSHRRDESEDHKTCISNLSDVTSLEITCKGPDLFIWKHVNIWTPSFNDTVGVNPCLCSKILYLHNTGFKKKYIYFSNFSIFVLYKNFVHPNIVLNLCVPWICIFVKIYFVDNPIFLFFLMVHWENWYDKS